MGNRGLTFSLFVGVSVLAIILLLIGLVAPAIGAPDPVTGWHVLSVDGKKVLKARSDQSDANRGWSATLLCSASSGFSITLLAPSTAFSQHVTFVLAKTKAGATVRLWPDQDGRMSGMIGLKGADAIERELLDSERLSLKVSAEETSDNVLDFTFTGIGKKKNEVLGACPAF